MCQRKSGTDDCEHEFAGSRLRNPKPTQGDMRKVTARRAGTRSSSAFTNLNKSNTSGDKSIYVDELIRPIRKKRKFKWIIELYTKVNVCNEIRHQQLVIIKYILLVWMYLVSIYCLLYWMIYIFYLDL